MVVTHGNPPGNLGRAAGTGPCALTVGNFDGVHRGHRAMLARLAGGARELGLAPCVLTFEPHPREFFSPASAPARLTRLREKAELLAEAGVARLHVARFDAALAAMSADRFVEEFLARGLGAKWILAGRDFRFGARRAGDFSQLQESGARHGLAVEAMPEVAHDGARVSSSAVRAALQAGDLRRAETLLGRPYTMSGRVAHGDRLGRSLGYPTANIVLRRASPIAGIFVVEVDGLGQGVASVGVRPTVRRLELPLLEVYLFDWTGDGLYGRHLRVRFLEKLRDEKKFDGLPALREAIARDVAQAREYFATHA